MNKVNGYAGLDRFRIVAAIMVIAIHTAPFSSIGMALDTGFSYIVCRIAVPFFLMATGFFLLPQYLLDNKVDKVTLLYFAKKTCTVYALAMLLYLPVKIYAGYFSQSYLFSRILKDALFDGTFYHLWYLPASVLGVLIIFVLSRKCSIKVIAFVIVALYMVGLRGFVKLTGWRLLLDNSLAYFGIICIGSVIVSIVAVKMVGKLKKVPMQTDRAWIEISLENLRHNVQAIQNYLPKTSLIMAVVKADAYGHGAVRISKELNKLGIKHFCVASVDEGIELRKHGVRGEILVLGYTHPDRFWLLKRFHLTQTVVDSSYARTLNQYRRKLKVHIKVDTGMHRLGEPWNNMQEIEEIFRHKNLVVDGMYTHLCVSGSQDRQDQDFTQTQLDRFYQVVQHIEKQGFLRPKLHIQSSQGVFTLPELQCDYARVGIALYGAMDTENNAVCFSLLPVLSVKSRIALVRQIRSDETAGYDRKFTAKRDVRIATLTIGYADDIPRSLSCEVGSVLIQGEKVPIIGAICMDQLLVDVTNIPDVKQGDVAVIIGTSLSEEIKTTEIAALTGSIPNEILSRLGRRLNRIYLQK